jgi:hypothetical protein
MAFRGLDQQRRVEGARGNPGVEHQGWSSSVARTVFRVIGVVRPLGVVVLHRHRLHALRGRAGAAEVEAQRALAGRSAAISRSTCSAS